jgi:putative transposase
MKRKRCTIKEKIRILRETDGGKAIIEVCKERNIFEKTFHRWKRAFGMMDVSEAKRLKEPEKENTELRKMPADAMPGNHVLKFVNKKHCEPCTPNKP